MKTQNYNQRIYVHIDSSGAYLGNGGLLMLTCLARELCSQRLRVSVFDSEDKLTWDEFEWLSLNSLDFDIVSLEEALEDTASLIVTSWISPLLSSFQHSFLGIRRWRKNTLRRVRYWCQSELLRTNSRMACEAVRRTNRTIAINNQYLRSYYRDLGFESPIVLENWIRSDLFVHEPSLSNRENTIGFQSDRGRNYMIYEALEKAFPEQAMILCEGTQQEVAEAMRAADIFVYWNSPSEFISLFQGETFGMSLFEAMACGCACIARKHEGNRFLQDQIVLASSLGELIDHIQSFIDEEDLKETCRRNGLELIAKRYRFDDHRRLALKNLLCGDQEL